MLKSVMMTSVALLVGCSSPSESIEPEMSQPVADLPYSQGMSFSTLDAYLAHLQRLSAQDRPYYEEVEPGRYRFRVGRRILGRAEDEHVYTREELLERFGFSE